jgi:hypothetical protein
MTSERLEVQRTIPADPETIFGLLCDPHGHVAVDSSGMLMDATGEPVSAVGDSFVVHMDREALNDYPMGRYDVTVTIASFVRDREISWTILGQNRPQIGHVYGYVLEPVDDGTLVTSYYDWSSIDPVWREAGIFPVISEGALRATLGILARTVAGSTRRAEAAGQPSALSPQPSGIGWKARTSTGWAHASLAWAANAVAASISGAVRIQQPPICSLVSAKGPSVLRTAPSRTRTTVAVAGGSRPPANTQLPAASNPSLKRRPAGASAAPLRRTGPPHLRRRAPTTGTASSELSLPRPATCRLGSYTIGSAKIDSRLRKTIAGSPTGVAVDPVGVRSCTWRRAGTMPSWLQEGRDEMKRYLLSIYQPDGDLPPPERLQTVMADVDAVRRELEAAGAWVFGGGLHAPSTASTLRLKDGDILTLDGPLAEGKEHLGGFAVIKAPDLDAALEWGRKYARATTLPIEVRPFQGEAEE